jgi:hypothetical protein
MASGIPFHRELGSIHEEVAGRIPNWRTQLSTLIVAKNCVKNVQPIVRLEYTM